MIVSLNDQLGRETQRLGVRAAEASEASRSGANTKALQPVCLLVGYWARQVTMPENSKSSRIPGRADSAFVSLPQFPNQQLGKIDRVFALAQGLESHSIPHEGFPQKSFATSPLYLPIASDPTYHHLPRVIQSYSPLLRQSVGLINFCRQPLPQALVGWNLVVDPYPAQGPALLSPQVPRGWSRRFGFQHPMHLLVCSVLFRMPRRDKFDSNCQSCPPGAQTRKPRWTLRSERSAVVHADNLRVAVLAKQSHKNAACWPPTLVWQQNNTQQKTAEQIPHRQGFHSPSILGPKPPLEIHCPHLVAALGYRQATSTHIGTTWASARCMPIQFHSPKPLANRARTRSNFLRIQPTQTCCQLPAAPTAVSPPQSSDPAQPFRRSLSRRSMRTANSISQSTQAFLLEALFPFVPALATESEYPTELRHALLGLQSQLHKSHSAHHTSHFFPRHGCEKAGK